MVAEKIVVNAADWARYLKLKSEANALKKEVDKLEESFGIPEAAEVGAECQVEICNGNSDTVGKVKFYWYNGATIPAAWRRRIS